MNKFSNTTKLITFAIFMLTLASFACVTPFSQSETPTPIPSFTSYPTYTPFPTFTSFPTYTPLPPTATLEPTAAPEITGVGEWLEGHFFTIRVDEVESKTSLDGASPTNDIFLLVNVSWKANGLKEKHGLAGVDFELIDENGKIYRLAGMIYEPKSFKPFTENASYQKDKWVVTKVSGNGSNVYRLVYDLPSSATGLQLWFRNYPFIDLGLE